MNHNFGLVSVLLSILVVFCSSYDKVAKSLKNLEKYGYLDLDKSGTGKLLSTDAIGRFQEYAGLKKTKILDNETIAKLEEPRCGMRDPSFEKRAKRYVHQGTKWHKRKLTYKVITYSSSSNRLSRSQIRKTVKATLDKWMEVANLDFIETTSDNADIRIRFVRRSHGDPYQFDGRGGTLAHAFYPGNNKDFSGDAHFDDDEHYTLGSPFGTNFYWVALHEFGHSIGLEHSNQLGAVMYPWYQGYKGDDAKLTYDDIIGIQHLYGARAKKPVNPNPTKAIATQKPRPITPKKKSPRCFNRIKAVLLGKGDRTFVINDDSVYILGKFLKVQHGPLKLSTFFHGLTKIDTATKMGNNDIVFFQGDKFWIFDGNKLRTGPLPITRYGLNKDMNNLDAVLSWRGTTKQYFFKGDRFWRFDYMTRRVDPGYPKSMKSWKGIPSNIDSVFQWRNKAIYFFKGEKFYRFDSRRIKAVPGYPRSIQGDFVICNSHRNKIDVNSNSVSESSELQVSDPTSSAFKVKQSRLVLSFVILAVVLVRYY